MRVLALDVAINGCSVAILDTEKGIFCQKRIETDRGQAEFLLPMIEDVSGDSACPLNTLNLITVTRGPGSFTGVRIGLATAKSLGMSLNIPIIGISTLDVIAREHGIENTLVLIDTKRDDFYGQIGEGKNAEPKIWSHEDVKIFSGQIIKDAIPDIEMVARMGIEIYERDLNGITTYDLQNAPQPLYLRGAEVSESKKKNLNIL